MAEQTIMAQVRARLFAEEVGNHTPSKIATDKFLSDNSSSALYPLAITVNGDAITQSRPLIDAINAISSDQTIKTSITLKAKYHPHAGFKTVNPYNLVIDFTIVIDWENASFSWERRRNSVIWTGSRTATRDAPQGKKYNGSAAPSDSLKIEPISGGNAANDWAIVLGTTSARNITRLPIPGLEDSFRQSIINYLFGSWDGYINVDYVITTDTGATVIAAPTPPPAPAAPVARVKISELPTAPPLQDDDLFVLSQDNSSDGDYDTNYHVTLASLKGALSTSFQSGIWVAGNTLSVSTTNVTSCRISIATGLNVTATEQDETGNIMGQFDVSSKILYLAQVYTGGSGSNATPMEHTATLTDVLQDMSIKPTYNGVTVRARFDADTLSIELTGANMRGTYLIALS